MNSAQRHSHILLFSILLCWATSRAKAEQEPGTANSSNDSSSIFEAGRCELTLNNGVLFSPFVATRNRPTIDYTITEFQFGCMLTEVKGEDWFQGNLEIVGDAFGSGIYKGSGTYIVGGTTWLRYNFVPSRWRFSLYAQAGGGFVITDIDEAIVGQRFNFNLGLAPGIRYFLNSRLSTNLEFRYQHISNANLGRKNLGINACGPILGLSWFF